MTKIVYNACYGGFSLSDEAIERYAELKGLNLVREKTEFGFSVWKDAVTGEYFNDRDIERDDLILVQVVEELGDDADGGCAKLVIEELAPGTQYRIDEYDGFESVCTRDSYDWKTV